jgi:prepilin-type N-terminal cleavage/methylation domain-containing protein
MSNNPIKKSNISRSGFTLIEVIIALSIIMVGIIGAYGLVNQTISALSTASMQLTAAYLGKEGIEIVRNIRDNNDLAVHHSESGYDNADSWMSGLVSAGVPSGIDCSSGCDGDYLKNYLARAYASQPLNFDGNFFNHNAVSSTNIATPYTRSIIITSAGSYLDVLVQVSWNERGRNHSLKIKEYLYDVWPQS